MMRVMLPATWAGVSSRFRVSQQRDDDSKTCRYARTRSQGCAAIVMGKGMSLFSTLFGASSKIEVEPPEHAVIVHFEYDGSHDLKPLLDLQERLQAVIAAAQAGEFEGKEIGADGTNGRLFMFGPDADRLFEVIKPLLAACPFMGGARVQLLYGPPEEGVRERNILLGERLADAG